MVKLVASFLLFFAFQADCMSSAVQKTAVAQLLDTAHKRHVPGIYVLPKGKLTKAEMAEVYLSLDEDRAYTDERTYLRRNLIGISTFLRKANPRFNEMVGSTSNILLLDAYTSIVCNIPVFAACGSDLQHAILCLRNDCLARPFFMPDDVRNFQFLGKYGNTGGTLREALVDFLCTDAYKPDTANRTIADQTRICSDHMLDHFVSSLTIQELLSQAILYLKHIEVGQKIK